MDKLSYYFTKDHIWVLQTDAGTVRIGVTNYAQSRMEGILFLDLPEVGGLVSAGGHLGDIEHVKKVTELVSPVSGVVTAVNGEVMETPSLINIAPDDSWLVEVLADPIPEGLLSQEEYDGYVRGLLGIGHGEGV